MIMYMDIQADRAIPDEACIIPSKEYKLRFHHVILPFTFEFTDSYVDRNDKHVLHVKASGLSVKTFPDSIFLSDHLINDKLEAIEPFPIHIEHPSASEIHPIKITFLAFSLDDGKIIIVNQDIIDAHQFS